MASRNVHKQDVSIFTLPQDAIQEDRGLSVCGVPQLVLADINDPISYKNDRTAIAYKFDSMTIELEDDNGALTAAPGVAVSFPNQSDAVGFVIDWRQVLNGLGALAQGCYKVRVNWTLAGNSKWFYHGAYQLREYSVFNARGTVRLYVVLNDLVRKQGINYKDSGFAGTVRFEGMFGFMQPNYDTENNTHTNRERYKVRREALRTYELRTSYLNRCSTRLIDEDTLLAANQIYITDHNAANHDRYYDFPVILDEDESPSFEYPVGSVFAKITAKFLDKVAYHESKFDGNIQGSENVILQLPTAVASCAAGAVTLDGAPLVSVPSGLTVDVQLVDQNGATITPLSIVGGVIEVDQTPPPENGTALLLKSGDSNDTRGRDIDFYTLGSPLLDSNGNYFLNSTLERFTDTLGTQIYADDIVIDRSTFEKNTGRVLGYTRTLVVSSNNWASANTAAESTSIGLYTSGWLLVSKKEFESLQDLGTTSGAVGLLPTTVFVVPSSGVKFFLTRNEYAANTTLAWHLREGGNDGTLSKSAVASACYIMASRMFTWNGTTLT